MTVTKTHGLTPPPPDPHQMVLEHWNTKFPDSRVLATTGAITIVVDLPLVDSTADSRCTR